MTPKSLLHLSPLGRGRPRSGRVRGRCPHDGRSVWSIISRTPERLSYTLTLVTRTTWKPNASIKYVRSMSRRISACVLWVAPSSSTITFPSIVAKSTMYRPIGCCRRNFQCARRRPRNACQRRASALVWAPRNLRARCLKRFIPLTRLLRSRPLPDGERFTRTCGIA
jgi:hypothetical protein